MRYAKSGRRRTGAFRAEELEPRLMLLGSGTETATISSVISGEDIRLLPLNGPNFSDLMRLVPGNCNAQVVVRGDNLSQTRVGRSFEVTGTNFSIDSIELSNADARSTLDFEPARGFDIEVDSLQSDGAVNSITGNGVRLNGFLTLPGARNVSFLSLSNSSVYVGNSILNQSFKTGSITDTQLTFGSSVNLLQSGPIVSSSPGTTTITAAYINQFKVLGDANLNLTLSSGPKYGLTAANITGAVSGGTWNVGGACGQLKADSFSHTWQGSFGNRLSFIQSRGAFNGYLQSTTIGDANFGTADSASIFLTQPFISNLSNLKSLNVAGSFNNSFIRSDGNLGNLKFQNFTGSSVFAGVDPNAQIGVLPIISQLQSHAMIQDFSVNGKGGSFTNSYVAGSFLGSIDLGWVIPQPSGPSFGITTNKIRSLRWELGGRLIRSTNLDRALDLSLAEQRAHLSPTELGNFSIRFGM